MKLLLFLMIPVALVAQIPNPFGGGGGAGGTGLPLPLGSNGTCLTITGGVAVWGSCSGSGNAGTVTSVGITSLPAWLTGSVATGTSTPAITLAGAGSLTSHQVVGTCGTATTAALCNLVLGDLPGTVVNATSPGAGVAHFAGSTQTLTSSQVSLTTDVTGILPKVNGGTGSSSPSLVAGTNVTITGSWPNQTINSTGGGGGGTNVYTLDNVISDGAAGDCVTDDTAVIQAALDNTATNVVYLPTPTSCYLTTDVLLGRSNQTVIGASRPASGTNGGIKNNNPLASGIVWSNSGTVKGTYTSGITATGTASQTCLLTAFNGTGGSGAVATIKLTGTNTIASGTILNFTAYGSGYTGTSTSATVGNGTATCTGTPVLVTRIGAGARNVVIQNLNVTDSALSRSAGNGIAIDGTGSAANFHIYDSHVQGFENGIDFQGSLNSGIQNVRGDSQLNDFVHGHGQANTGIDIISAYGDAPANFCFYGSIMNYSSLVATSCDASGSDAYHFETADGGQSRGLRLQIGTENPVGHGLSLDASGVTIENAAITGVPTGKSDIFLNGADTVTIDGGYLTGGDYAVNVNADPGHSGSLSSLHIVNPPHASGQGTATYKDTNHRLVYLSDLNPGLPCNDTSGSGTVQVCNTNQTFTPTAGNAILYNTTTSNTGDVTVNVNSLGAKHIRKWSGSAVLASGDLVANTPVLLIYDGTYWEIQTLGNAPTGTGTVTVVGAGTLTSTDCVTGGGTQTIQTPSANCTVDSSGNLDANSVTTTGSSAGIISLTNNATPGTPVANSWGWTAPATITTAWYGEAPNSNPTSNQVMLFGAPSSNVSQWAWTNFTIAGMGSTTHNVEAPLTCADSSGSGTTQVCTTSPTFTPASGDAILYSTTTSNTGDVTVNVNSLGAKHIRKWSGSSTLALGDLVANTPVQLIYDGTFWEISTIGNAPGGTGTVTSVATTSPLGGGTITSSGTLTCTTCVTSAASLTAGGIMYGAGSQASAATSAGTSGQMVLSGGSGAPTMIDFPERLFIPAANCNNTTAGAGWSIGSGGTVTCRAGTNNQGGYVTITDTSSTFAQFTITIPEDWDTGTRPYIRFFLSSTDTTNTHTIIPAIKVSCPTAGNGTTTDDATFSASQSSSTVTVGASAVSNGFYNGSNVQIGSTQMTGCIAGGLMIVQVGRATDTATSANFIGANVTFPRLVAVQAN